MYINRRTLEITNCVGTYRYVVFNESSILLYSIRDRFLILFSRTTLRTRSVEVDHHMRMIFRFYY